MTLHIDRWMSSFAEGDRQGGDLDLLPGSPEAVQRRPLRENALVGVARTFGGRASTREHLPVALGIGVPTPRLSWNPVAPPGWKQDSYQLKVGRAGNTAFERHVMSSE